MRIPHLSPLCRLNDFSRSRDDKRYTEKKNKSERARRKKEDTARLRQLVDLALSVDPRIKRIKQEEKDAREAKKKVKASGPNGVAAKQQAEEEKKREEEEAKKKEEEEKVRPYLILPCSLMLNSLLLNRLRAPRPRRPRPLLRPLRRKRDALHAPMGMHSLYTGLTVCCFPSQELLADSPSEHPFSHIHLLSRIL